MSPPCLFFVVILSTSHRRYNPDANVTHTGADLAVDHVAVHSRGTLSNDGRESASLGQQRPQAVADGKVHLVKVGSLGWS